MLRAIDARTVCPEPPASPPLAQRRRPVPRTCARPEARDELATAGFAENLKTWLESCSPAALAAAATAAKLSAALKTRLAKKAM